MTDDDKPGPPIDVGKRIAAMGFKDMADDAALEKIAKDIGDEIDQKIVDDVLAADRESSR